VIALTSKIEAVGSQRAGEIILLMNFVFCGVVLWLCVVVLSLLTQTQQATTTNKTTLTTHLVPTLPLALSPPP
jgi:hypothetical protein